MKYFVFVQTSNNFEDILQDVALKKYIRTKIMWTHHLLIGIEKNEDHLESYIRLKYSDILKEDLIKDYSPIIGVDYVPKRT